MVQRGEDFGFALEAGQAFGIGRHCLRQDLDGDLPLQVGVRCAIHLTHATHAERGHDFVRAEARAGDQSQRHVRW